MVENNTTTVYLVRHAAYENPQQIFHGRLPGFPLSIAGRAAANKLADFFADKSVSVIWSSPLTRAKETADIIAKKCGLPVATDERLLDIRSPLQGKPLSYINSLNWDIYQPEFIAMGAEKLSEVYDRMNDFFCEKVKMYAGKTLVVVSHGDEIMSIMNKYSGESLPKYYTSNTWYVPMASGIKIVFDETGHPISVTKLPAEF